METGRTGSNGALTERQRCALEAIIAARGNYDAAAAAAGVSVKTLYNYRQLPDFADELERVSAGALMDAAQLAKMAAARAVEYLLSVVDDDTAATGDRIRAARAILNDGAQLITTADHEQRLAKLEGAENDGRP